MTNAPERKFRQLVRDFAGKRLPDFVTVYCCGADKGGCYAPAVGVTRKGTPHCANHKNTAEVIVDAS